MRIWSISWQEALPLCCQHQQQLGAELTTNLLCSEKGVIKRRTPRQVGGSDPSSEMRLCLLIHPKEYREPIS